MFLPKSEQSPSKKKHASESEAMPIDRSEAPAL